MINKKNKNDVNTLNNLTDHALFIYKLKPKTLEEKGVNEFQINC